MSDEQENFAKLAEMFPDFATQKYSYLRLESPGFEPLSLEWIFGDRISVMHTYELNGDLCYDPMIEFTVNSADKTMNAVAYQNSGLGLYQYHDEDGIGRSVDGNGNQREVRDLSGKLNEFSAQWFSNIAEQGFMPVKATLWNEGRIDDVDVSVTFDKDGNPQMPVGYLRYADSGEKVPYFSADEIAAAYKREIYSLPMNAVRYEGVEDGEIRQKLDVILADEYGIDGMYSGEAAAENVTLAPEAEAQKEPTLDVALPDPSVTLAEMNAYGYTEPDMYPLSIDRVVEMFDNDNPIYLLYPDNTEAMAFDRDEIITFMFDGGLCGITKADWESSPSYRAHMAVAMGMTSGEYVRESGLLTQTPGMFGIYQIRDGIDEARNVRFASMKELAAHGITPDRANYELVYTAPLNIHDRMTNLHKIFSDFQHDSSECPQDFSGRSVSVSDVIVLQWRGEVSAHYVDSADFKELPSFTGNEREIQPDRETLTNYNAAKVQRQDDSAKFSQVGKTSDAPTVAALESDVKAGKTVSLSDLSKAVNNERKPPAPKGKPSLHDRLQAGKQRAAMQGKANDAPLPDAQKTTNHREV